MNASVKYIKKYSWRSAPLWVLIVKEDGIEYHVTDRMYYHEIKQQFVLYDTRVEQSYRHHRLQDYLELYEITKI